MYETIIRQLVKEAKDVPFAQRCTVVMARFNEILILKSKRAYLRLKKDGANVMDGLREIKTRKILGRDAPECVEKDEAFLYDIYKDFVYENLLIAVIYDEMIDF